MHRTPFTARMLEETQPPTYRRALLRQRSAPDLPYTMEACYLRKKILNVQWDDKRYCTADFISPWRMGGEIGGAGLEAPLTGECLSWVASPAVKAFQNVHSGDASRARGGAVARR
jgi:hypothetical protein